MTSCGHGYSHNMDLLERYIYPDIQMMYGTAVQQL